LMRSATTLRRGSGQRVPSWQAPATKSSSPGSQSTICSSISGIPVNAASRLTALRLMLPEIRHVLRSLAKCPSSAVLTVVVFALAIGATTSVFTVFNGFFLRPMPFPDDRVVMIYGSMPKAGVDDTGASVEGYLDFRTRVPALEE